MEDNKMTFEELPDWQQRFVREYNELLEKRSLMILRNNVYQI